MDEASVQRVLGLAERTAWIITSRHDDQMGGLVATFVSNASLVPALPRLIAGIARHHFTWELISRSRSFAAHVVDERHCELIWRFGLGSGRTSNKLSGVAWHQGPAGSPVLDDALAWIDCSVEAELDIGDRTIFVGAVIDGNVMRPGEPLTASRLFEMAGEERRQRLLEERRHDEQLDAAAILRWRQTAASGS
jgi:flavin reductase (DIM6/NTAB) family NADH-FMN oxidoreductase RutF